MPPLSLGSFDRQVAGGLALCSLRLVMSLTFFLCIHAGSYRNCTIFSQFYQDVLVKAAGYRLKLTRFKPDSLLRRHVEHNVMTATIHDSHQYVEARKLLRGLV